MPSRLKSFLYNSAIIWTLPAGSTKNAYNKLSIIKIPLPDGKLICGIRKEILHLKNKQEEAATVRRMILYLQL